MSGCLVEGESGTLDGTVTDADTTLPIAGAAVDIVDDKGFDIVTSTDSSGYYSQTLGIGTYTVTVSAVNYLPAGISGLTILTDTVTTQDFALQPAPFYTNFSYIPYAAREN
jgi:hypothetical protein